MAHSWTVDSRDKQFSHNMCLDKTHLHSENQEVAAWIVAVREESSIPNTKFSGDFKHGTFSYCGCYKLLILHYNAFGQDLQTTWLSGYCDL